MSKKNVVIVEEATPDRNGHSIFEVELEPGIATSAIRWIGKTEPLRWSITLAHVAGPKVRIRERDRGTIELESDFIEPETLQIKALGKVRRARSGSRLRHEAMKLAEQFILERYRQLLEKGECTDATKEEFIDGREPALNQVFAELRRRHALGGGKAQQRTYERVMDIASYLWEGATRRPSEIAQNDVNYWFGKRCGKRIDDLRREYRFGPGDSPGIIFPKSYSRRSLPVENCDAWTAKSDLLELSAVFNTAVSHKIIAENPLDGLRFSDAQKGDRDPYYAERFHLVLPFLDTVDPTGALRFRIIITYETAARPSTVAEIRVEDFRDSESEILRSIRQIRNEKTYAAIREKPLDDWAEVWAVENGGHGALYQRHLKGKGRAYVRITPLNAILRDERNRYLAKRSEMGIDSPLMFPHPSDPHRPMDADVVREQYRAAEQMARDYWTAYPEEVHDYLDWWSEDGVRVEKYLDERVGDVIYPYRHLWENVHDTLGWTDNRNASYVGGWTTQRMGGSQGNAYRKLNPHHMLAIMEGKKLTEVIAESAVAERAKRIRTSDSRARAEALSQRRSLHTSAHTRVA